VEEAKRDATEIVAQAQREAARIMAEAEAEAARRAEEQQARSRAEAEASHRAVLEAVRAEVDEARAGMDSRFEAAVVRVMERVVP
jgi:F0F1-type ATP synthase membrane subunit b/b'